jgi:hypothetical protein
MPDNQQLMIFKYLIIDFTLGIAVLMFTNYRKYLIIRALYIKINLQFTKQGIYQRINYELLAK